MKHFIVVLVKLHLCLLGIAGRDLQLLSVLCICSTCTLLYNHIKELFMTELCLDCGIFFSKLLFVIICALYLIFLNNIGNT